MWNNFLKKVAVLTLGILLILPIGIGSMPQPAQAQLLVSDPGNTTGTIMNLVQNTITAVKSSKDLLAPIFWALSKATLQSLVASTVNWINTGFNGSPAYITDLNQTLRSVADAEANSYLQQLSSNNSIRSPFQDQVFQYIRNNYYRSSARDAILGTNTYTLNQYTQNDTAFLAGATTKGGFNAWFAAILNPANTPVGAAQLAANELQAHISGAQAQRTIEVNWGQGLGSFRGKCTSAPAKAGGTTSLTSLSSAEPCYGASIQTPGSLINAAAIKAGGAGIDTLVSAKDFDQIVNALLSQLILHVAGGSGSFRDLSRPSSNTGGTSYFDQADASQGTINNTVSSDFTATVNAQISQIQQYQSGWITINSAAQDAKSALTTSLCDPTSTTATLTNTVQPVIDQSTTAISNASAAIAKLNNVLGELPGSSNNLVDSTEKLSKTYDDFRAALASDVMPSTSEITFIATQSIDVGTSSPASLYTQMKGITAAAQRCSIRSTQI